ncbi:unnamed protein product [Sphagnum jensenii]|uniref:riboflavin kinase n=1 Tax=Sphagnum jensenii TaxID=128206 RepID=A0ABP1A667_9BRYO
MDSNDDAHAVTTAVPSSPLPPPQQLKIYHVILDLDGTLIDTETLVEEALELIVSGYGKKWNGEGAHKRLGKRPLESAASLIQDYDLPCTPQELYSQILDFMKNRWAQARALPGANRLVTHLHSHGVPFALASSSPAKNIKAKLSYQAGWTEAFTVVVAGDEVINGKPAPDIFLEAAKRLNADPATCLVIEDAPAGVKAGKAAGMTVLAVPSLPTKEFHSLYSDADVVLNSLLDLEPETWGLPPFEDRIGGVLPMGPLYMGGPVVMGFGRGSKLLGIPTANLATTALSKQLAENVCGVYIGWAGLANHGVYKMVMNIGWSPYFNNAEKTVEPWLLHDFAENFYGVELRLVVVGYIRPEANFVSLEALVERIHEDGQIAKAALDMTPYSQYAEDPYLTTLLPNSAT